MANHVYFNVDFVGVSEELWNKTLISEPVTKKGWDDSNYTINELKELHKLPFFDHIEKEYEDGDWLKDSYDFYVNNIGAKWCNIDSWEETSLTGYSAWSPPIELVRNMVKYFQEHSVEAISARITYEDEFRNFIGINEFYTEFDGEVIVHDDENYIDCEELQDMLNFRLSELTGQDIDVSEREMDDEIPTLSGGVVVPQEFADEMVYNFWETGDLT